MDADGWVDWASIKASVLTLDSYLETVANAGMDEFGRNDRLAFLVNAYNAQTLKLIVERFPLKSIKNIPADER